MTLKSKLKSLPQEPGVYLFKDKAGKIIYVGKATCLSKRVRSYFQKKRPALPKDLILRAKIADFDYIVANSEVEALILENNLIKTYKPGYNVTFKDDKTYPLLKITTQEEFPGIFTTRRASDDGAKYFGPYTHSGNLRQTLKLIQEIFQIRTCKYKLNAGKKLQRPCLNFDIKRCLAPCCGNVSKEDYQKMVEQVCLFLNGRVEELINELKIKMKNEAQALRFEKSAIIRDQIFALKNVMTRQQVVSLSQVDQDIIGIAELSEPKQICAVVFLIRAGRLIGDEHYFLKIDLTESVGEILTAFLKQYYSRKTFIPKELILPGRIEEENTIKEWLNEKKGAKVKISVPKRGEKKYLIDLATKNAAVNLLSQKAEENIKILILLQNYLHLPILPKRIEAFDISCLTGKDAVGSLVVFEEAQPKKSEYRRFKIKGADLAGDVAMLEEVIRRRYTRVLNEKKPLPDLILVDGGRQQLNIAFKVLSSLGISNIPLISLAKPQKKGEREKIFTHSSCLIPPPDSNVLHLIQQIRNSAHRFAIAYHHQIKRKSAVRAQLR
ncbi:MAG: excinuclease ABC subunit UvrC [bacterium]